MQLGLVYGAVSGVLGLVFAIIWLPFGAMVASVGNPRASLPFAGIGIAAIVVFPVMYFILGFIGALITAAIYNVVATWTGGVEVTLSAPVETTLPPSPQGYSV